MSLFKSLRRLNASSKSSVQAPFAQAGSASQSVPALPQEDDYDSAQIRERCPRFRTLIIGRANAGKTTILQKVCGTTKKPVVYDVQGEKRGLHDINNTMVFKSNPGFIFHDSRGFEAGGAQELDDVTTFLAARAGSMKLEDQVHAVWYCIPLDDDRPFTRAEINFFSECGTGSVPVIVIFTKFDAMDDKAFGELIEQGLSTDEARARAPDHAAVIFERDLKDVLYGMKYPPKSHVLLRDMNHPHASCKELVDCTASGIDNAALKLLFVSTQRTNLALCMESAINEHGSNNGNIFDVPRKKLQAQIWAPTYLFNLATISSELHHIPRNANKLPTDLCTLDLTVGLFIPQMIMIILISALWTGQLFNTLVSTPSGQVLFHSPRFSTYATLFSVALLSFAFQEEDVMTPDIQSRLETLVVGSGESSQASSMAAVFIIILDLSFFIWDKKPSPECFSQALGVYEKATSHHEAVMRAVEEATRMKQDSTKERKAFIARMREIVLSHRLGQLQGRDWHGLKQKQGGARSLAADEVNGFGIWNLYSMIVAKSYEPNNPSLCIAFALLETAQAVHQDAKAPCYTTQSSRLSSISLAQQHMSPRQAESSALYRRHENSPSYIASPMEDAVLDVLDDAEHDRRFQRCVLRMWMSGSKNAYTRSPRHWMLTTSRRGGKQNSTSSKSGSWPAGMTKMAIQTRAHEPAGRKNDVRSRRIRDITAAPTNRRAFQELMELQHHMRSSRLHGHWRIRKERTSCTSLRCKPCKTTSPSGLRSASA
ncbi:hypothetical protein FIBSPDRAFT_895415 [Athelia psychrophila]|uniref:G domain-containing protein n=1 Tax=Athelia psychrophila TaxID=1759441 RepID=A0A166EM56_9AGAM|nr:hypothetical protein FIBSPDRAFT_895415 [Fibularhizoctonia sp. CBS 109695]